MSNKQRILALVLLGIIASTLLYPNMHVVSLYGDRPLGRHWIFAPPYDIAKIDFNRLVVEWIFIGLTIGAFYIAKPFLEKYRQRSYMIAIPIIRIIRIFLAFSILLVAFGIPFSFFSKELIGNENEVDFGKWFSLLTIKIVLLFLLVLIFFGLRRLINLLHIALYGSPHPKIIKRWDI